MKPIKFSFIIGIVTVAVSVLVDFFTAILLTIFGFAFPSQYSFLPFDRVFGFLEKYSYGHYLTAFILGFLIGFPVFYIKRKIDKWVEKNSKSS